MAGQDGKSRRRTIRIRARLANIVDHLSESYWFLPTAICAVAAALAFLLGWIEVVTGFDTIETIGFGPPLQADSARAILTTLATSIISVAGVAFSVLIAAVVFASGQFGPRIIGNFMRDRSNQIALGVFLATFSYCLLVLRLVIDSYVPTLSILFAYVMAALSVITLIHFFHHASESIRLSWIISDVGGQLLKLVEHRFPEHDDHGPETASAGHAIDPGAIEITSRHAGSLRFVDFSGLVALAAERKLVLRLDRMPGDFVALGRPLAWAWPAEAVDEEVKDLVREACKTGSSRTPAQDLHFVAQLLMDVASRALSTGINDPRTAMACLDWIGAGVSRASRGRPLGPGLCDGDGSIRVIMRPHSFAEFANFAIGRLRPHFQTEPSAALHMMATLGTLMLDVTDPDQRHVLLEHARRLAEGARASLKLDYDVRAVEARLAVVEEIAAGRLVRPAAAAQHHWL